MEDELERLRKFAREAIQTAFEGGGLDGGEIQDMAERLGLVERVPFDPEKHDGPGAAYCYPGDDWFLMRI